MPSSNAHTRPAPVAEPRLRSRFSGRIGLLGAVALLVAAPPARAHEAPPPAELVISTDVGLDDVAALALALQSPHLDIGAIVVVDGVLDPRRGAEIMARLLAWFNREDIPLFVAPPVRADKDAPVFRRRVWKALSGALPATQGVAAKPFSADAYRPGGGRKRTVLALGPFSGLAAALRQRPALREELERVVTSGAPTRTASWNARFDPDAWAAVGSAGLRIDYVVHGALVRKPAAWKSGDLAPGRATALGDQLMTRLLRSADVAAHYVTELPSLTDELAVLYLLQPRNFRRRAGPAGRALVRPAHARALISAYAAGLRDGRQVKRRVVLSDGLLHPASLQPDIRRIRTRALAAHGSVEWLAQLLMNEIHQHLGAYSIIGVKMGLRAAELLNAPQHGMQIRSLTVRAPPVSCLNDGVIVATGSTPGRGLFRQVASPTAQLPKVHFSYNGRSIVLALKERYREQIAATIRNILARFPTSHPGYWRAVRREGLSIWTDWHRLDLFDVEQHGGGEAPRSLTRPPAAP